MYKKKWILLVIGIVIATIILIVFHTDDTKYDRREDYKKFLSLSKVSFLIVSIHAG